MTATQIAAGQSQARPSATMATSVTAEAIPRIT